MQQSDQTQRHSKMKQMITSNAEFSSRRLTKPRYQILKKIVRYISSKSNASLVSNSNAIKDEATDHNRRGNHLKKSLRTIQETIHWLFRLLCTYDWFAQNQIQQWDQTRRQSKIKQMIATDAENQLKKAHRVIRFSRKRNSTCTVAFFKNQTPQSDQLKDS